MSLSSISLPLMSSLLRLRSEQSTMLYCRCYGVKSLFLCLSTNEGSMKMGGGSIANISDQGTSLRKKRQGKRVRFT